MVTGLRASGLLGGSWVVISGVISPLMQVRTIVTLLITLLITTHEPPSRLQDKSCLSLLRPEAVPVLMA